VVDAPKPKAKPEPPKQEAKVEPKPPEKKQEKFDLDSILKNLSKNAAPKPDEVKDKPAKPTPPQQQVASAQPMNAPLGAELSTSEKDLIKRQITERWNIDPGAKGLNEIQVEMRVWVRRDATVERVEILSTDRMSEPVYRSVAESLRRAALSFRDPNSPLRLPLEKYDTWKTFVIIATPKDAV
jgi:outer membrane biosynthesis protein TonB